MKPPLRTVLILSFVGFFLRLGNSCGPFFENDTFMLQSDPDAPYSKFVAGRLGLLQSTYRIRHMVVAYNTLSGRGLSPAEQKAAIDVDTYYNAPGDGGFGEGERLVPGSNWERFNNCLDDAKSNAGRTLADRRARYGKPGAPDTPELLDWQAGQAAVFSNCGGVGQMPQPAPANAPLWLKQDRAYQTAAAQFYALDYDAALTSFRAIAADHASPWAQLARYLIARTFIRKAIVPYVPYPEGQPTPQQLEPAKAAVRDGLAQARDQLEAILRDPAMKPMHSASSHLLDYVMARLDPAAQANELARRLTAPGHADTDEAAQDYKQNIIDLGYIYNTLPPYAIATWTPYEQPNGREIAPFIRWLNDMGRFHPLLSTSLSKYAADRFAANQADAINSWRQTHGMQWLVAALAIAQPGQAESADLIAAARTVPAASPAYATITFHRLRLESMQAKPADAMPATTKPVFDELAALMPGIEKSQPRSTINAFADSQSRLAPTLNDFLRNASRIAAAYGSEDTGYEQPVTVPDSGPVTLCGVSIDSPDARHLDDQTALIFNQRMPLRMLGDAALSSALPPNVRFQVAHMAWTRAMLLDDAETSRALTPYLAGCQPAIAPWLRQYDAAKSTDERHVLGLLALMRFTSTEPTVRVGLERDFGSYDSYRDNWWCSAEAGFQQSQASPKPHLFDQEIVPRLQQPDPPFLAAADRAEADKEIAALQKIPCASDYFARQTLAWVKDHPDDAHNADLIGFAMRVVRNACRSNDTKELNHQLFDLLHRSYPKSEWATRYTTWE